MNERPDRSVLTGWNPDDDPTQDTIALLQDEIARLESELRARDEALFHPAVDPGPAATDPAAEVLSQRVAELTAELAARDETVDLLLEQTRLFEEAAAAQRSEWDQLRQWVEEVERRVEGRDTSVDGLRSELEAERSRAEVLRREREADRRDWEAVRAGLDREVKFLRSRLDDLDDTASSELRAAEEENRCLHEASVELKRISATAAEADELRRDLATAQADLEQSRAALQSLGDELRRERNEFTAEINALRSRISRESLQNSPVDRNPESGTPTALEADERIRAFRQHLKELHDREADERAKLSFSARLSRLWRHTGPGG